MKPLNERGALKTAMLAFALMLAAWSLAIFNVAAQDNSGGSHLYFQQTHHEKATVEAIDHAKREITLREQDGSLTSFAVSDAVKNFPQIKKGDVMNFGYRESVLLSLHKQGEAPSPTGQSQGVTTRGLGEKPGAVATSVSEITATVENVDRANREVTLKGPEGHIEKVQVDPSVGDLSQIKQGDRITARRTSELIVTVEPPGSSR